MFEAAYLSLYRSRELEDRAQSARQALENCTLCGNHCHVNRLQEPGQARCRTGEKAVVCSASPHHGEERPLSGRNGSGTIFFGWCNLACVFCQNWQISHQGEGREMSAETLANQMLTLQSFGCHNINFVSSSHVIPQILTALVIAAEKGLKLPLVFNTGGYDSLEGLTFLDGVIDIYMPDMKFSDSATAEKFIGVKDYAEINQAAVKEMHRQVGDLSLSPTGLAQRGLMTRHLVLPGDLAGSKKTLEFIAEDISTETYLNLMGQYRPCFQAHRYAGIGRAPSRAEMAVVREAAKELGLHRLD